MDQGLSTGTQQTHDGLRERVSRPDSTGRDALMASGEVEFVDKFGHELKTFGRTPDGTGMTHFFQSQLHLSSPCVLWKSC
jgi:phosphatidylethanolamine N-methyltransferase